MVVLWRPNRFWPASSFLKMSCSLINSGIRSVTRVDSAARERLGPAALACLPCRSTVGVIVLINHKQAVICPTLIRSDAESRSNSLWDL